MGMASDFKDTIFDAFTRAESSLTNKIQGTGLGMAITKNLVEAMGGTIDVGAWNQVTSQSANSKVPQVISSTKGINVMSQIGRASCRERV